MCEILRNKGKMSSNGGTWHKWTVLLPETIWSLHFQVQVWKPPYKLLVRESIEAPKPLEQRNLQLPTGPYFWRHRTHWIQSTGNWHGSKQEASSLLVSIHITRRSYDGFLRIKFINILIQLWTLYSIILNYQARCNNAWLGAIMAWLFGRQQIAFWVDLRPTLWGGQGGFTDILLNRPVVIN